MRQLCNASYAAMVEWADEADRKKIDRELVADDPATVSTGTNALIGLLGVRPPTEAK